MIKRNMKKIIMAITTALVVVGTAVSNVIPVWAEPGEESGNSIVVDEGEIVLDTDDIDTLQNELESLEAELPDASKMPYYGIARKSRLNSKGVIDYANKTVIIDSSDFVFLADEIDELESDYKANVVSALNDIKTFFRADGSIGHETDSERNSGEEAVRLSFDTIISGIQQSQSVAHLAEQGIAGAIEDNLSKGTAAWVDGKLIIGNGADNDAYYQKGIDDVVDNPNDYGISTAPKADYLAINSNGVTYTIPADGTYTFHVITTCHQDKSNHAASCDSYLTIGNENITVFHYGYNHYKNEYEMQGSADCTITRTLTAGTVIKFSVTDPYIVTETSNWGNCIYTVASLTIY